MRKRTRRDLSPEDGLHSPLPPTEAFDSSVEDGFAKKWGPEPRDGWRLAREGAILQQGQTVMIPDFTLTHESGRKVHLEVVGFWTPEYLRAKIEKLRVFRDEPILLAVAERIAARWPELPPGVIRYKTAIKLQDVLAALPLPPG